MKLDVTRIEQKGAVLYLGWLPASELIKRGQVDKWTPSHIDGYQRSLVDKRVLDVAWYLMESDGLMPTSVLVSLRCKAVFDEKQSVLDIPDEAALWVIDGQHRVAGLAKAIEKGSQELKDYPFPVTIMVNPDKFDEMRAFYLVNSKAKSVPTDVVERILQRTLLERGKDWILRKEASQVQKAGRAVNKAKAVGVVDYLRSQCPVWKDMVVVPGEPKPNPNAVKQPTIVGALLEGPYKVSMLAELDTADLGVLVGRYWEAAAEVWPAAFAEPKLYSIRKSVGVWSLSMLFVDVFERCREVRDYTKPKMVELLRFLGIDSEFWSSDPEKGDPRTLGSSMKAIRLVHSFLQEQLPKLTLAGM